MQEAPPAAAADAAAGAAPPAAPKQPFLRRGAGWEARMAAAREGRRYVPRGGNVKDYSQEGEAPQPQRRRPASSKAPQAPRSPAKAGAGARKAAVPTYAGPAARHKQPAARTGRSAPPSAAASPARPRPAERPQPVAAAPPGPAAASAGWARRLLQQHAPLAAAAPALAAELPVRAERQDDEAAALHEFEALESQVLREVHTNSPRPLGSSSKKAAASGAGVAAGAAMPRQPAADPRAQQQVAAGPESAQAGEGPENWAAGQEAEEDVFASDGEGGVCGLFGEGSRVQAAAAGVTHPLACRAIAFGGGSGHPAQPVALPGVALRRGPPPVYCEDEDDGEMHAESSFQDVPRQPASSLVQQFFSRPPAAASAAPPTVAARPAQPRVALPGDPQHASGAEAEALEQLQQEVVALQQERARVARMRLELEEAAGRLEQDKAAFEKRKVEDAARFDAERAEELRKLQRDRRVLEKQSRAILKMPTKQSKEEVAAVEALLAEERRAGRAQEARHKLAVERLRQQLVELQAKNSELQEQMLCLEQQRLAAAWGEVAAGAPAAAAAAVGVAAGAPRSNASSPSHAAAPVRHRASSSAPSQAPAAGRPGRASSLPAVRVERGIGSGSAARPAAALRSSAPLPRGQHLVQPPSWVVAAAEGAAVECSSYALEDAIADVELREEQEVVDWSEGQCSEQPEVDAAAAACGTGELDAAPLAAPGLELAGCDAVEVQQSWLPAASAGGHAPPAAPAAAGMATDAMSKASSALARFNQLRSSLARHDSLPGRLASGIASLQPSLPSLPSAVATPQPVDGADVAPSAVAPSAAATSAGPLSGSAHQDDLRRLGRTLLAGAAPSSAPAAAPDAQAVDAPCNGQQPSPPSATAGASGSAADAVVTEVQHPDGRWERLFASGAREQRFANGSVKCTLPSGASLTRFANGDVKKVLPCGTVEYFFAEVVSWQVTHPSGVDVFFFPSGQVEAHHPGGVKEVLFPDGAVRKLLPDGRELAISAAHLSREVQAPQPAAALE